METACDRTDLQENYREQGLSLDDDSLVGLVVLVVVQHVLC